MRDESVRSTVSLLRWVLLAWWVMMFAVTHWPEIEDLAPELGRIPHFDKLVHFGMFGAWAVLFALTFTSGQRPLRRKDAAVVLAIGALYAVFDEVTQGLVDRQPDIIDLTVDMLGVTAGLLLYRVLPLGQFVRAR